MSSFALSLKLRVIHFIYHCARDQEPFVILTLIINGFLQFLADDSPDFGYRPRKNAP